MAHILVIAPHGVDEVLGCGATIARHADSGDAIDILILFGSGEGADAKRRIAAPKAAAALGARTPVFAGLPENRGDTVPLADIISAIERKIGETKADTLYIPHPGNLHIDHQRTAAAAITAARPAPGQSVRTIYGYEVLSTTDWTPPNAANAFLPTRFVDASATLARKLAAIDCYKDEMRPAPHSRSVENVEALARTRGMTCGLAAAEAFSVLRQIV